MNTPAIHEYNLPILSAAWMLLRLRILIFVNSFRRAKLRQKISFLVLIVFVIGLIGFAFYISRILLQWLQSPVVIDSIGDVKTILRIIPTVLLSGAFVGILITSFGVLLQALYLAGDMDFLLAAPIPIRSVFLAKLLQAILPNFALICAFALPVLFGLGASQQYSLLYYPLVLLMLAALSLAAAGISSLLVMLAARFFPARRVVEVLGFIGGISSIICSQSGQFAQMEDVSPNQAAQLIALAARFRQPWSPLTWAGDSLAATGEGLWISGLVKMALTLGLALLVFGVSLSAAEKLYYRGWASVEGQKRKKKNQHAARQKRGLPASALVERILPRELRAILYKDFLVMQRDLRNLSQLITPLILGVVYTMLLLQDGGEIPAEQGDAPGFIMEALKNLSFYLNVGISLLVGWMLLGRLAGMGFGQEGKSFWLLKAAPIPAEKLIIAKFLVAFLPVLSLSWLFLVAISLLQHTSLTNLLFSLPVVALCIAGSAGVSLAFGISGAKLDWEDPRHMQTGGSGCLGALVSAVYMPVSLLLFFLPPLLMQIYQMPVWSGQILGLALGGAFSLACAILPLRAMRHAVSRLGEN